MARPFKWRRIDSPPAVPEFTPAGGGDPAGGVNTLLVEEYEAIRLKDALGLEQEACAERMQVSRATFQRILSNAREKIADSLVQGKGIRIEGGNWRRRMCEVVCRQCGNHWEADSDMMSAEDDTSLRCPRCGSDDIVCVPVARYGRGRGPGFGGGRGRGRGAGGGPPDDGGGFCRGSCWRYGQDDNPETGQPDPEAPEEP
jgi:predicted DNA-binding protein (UPF0251 family)